MIVQKRTLHWLLGFVSAVLSLTIITSLALADDRASADVRLLIAEGTGQARVRPDVAVVRLGVETEARTAADAAGRNAEQASRVVSAVRALGVPEQNIQTSTYQVQAVRRSMSGPQETGEPPIVGYRVDNIISVRTERLDLVPKIIDQSISSGANRVEDISFGLQNESTARQSALNMAVENARANAETMAKASGVKLVRVQRVQQGGAGIGPVMPLAKSMQASAYTPISPGEMTLDASVTLTYQIE